MASNVSPGQRTFALVIALIFLVTTVATGVLVVASIVNDSKNDASETATSTADTQTTNEASCPIGTESGQEKLGVPEIYKATADVTALEKTDLEVGTGAEVKAGDCVIAKYYGTLATSGEMFDENFTTDSGLSFQAGAGSVIQGWDEGVLGMKIGGTRRLVIPSDLAYGENGAGSIPANADLVFVVKITGFKE